MNKVKKLVMVLLVLSCVAAPLLAAQSMSVTWKWNHDDLDVAYYRYQLNSESEEGWTVVPSSVLSYDATDLDPYLGYTLYLQCSYDGENWSESAVALAEPLLVEEIPVVEEIAVVEAPVVEEVPEEVVEAPVEAVAEEPVVEVEEVPVVAEEPAVVEEAVPVKEKAEYGYKTNILITAGAATNVSYDKFALDGAFPRLGLGLEFQNIVHAGPWGLGLRVDVNVIAEPEKQDWNQFDIKNWYSIWFDSSADAKLMMYLGNESFDFYLGGGAGYTLFNPAFSTEADQNKFGHSLGNVGIFSSGWYVAGNVGMRVRFNDLFSLGAEANYRYLLPAEKHTASVDMVFGFSF